MFTFQSIMFVSLGFLCALLLGFVVAPAFWSRAVRLTTDRMRASLPLSEQEISADRDRLRAENAIRVHQLTAKIEQARLYDARQKVEINRRDGTISALERRLQLIETEREGSENARRVLEATITQRVPEIEARLVEARQLLAKRDAEMKALQNDTGKTFRALDDAMQVNAQQRSEIDRLKMSLAGQGNRVQSAFPGAETGTALRAELESLRARSREQAALISKLQRGDRNGKGAQRGDAALLPLKPAVANDIEGWDAPILDDAEVRARSEETARLKAKLAEQAEKIETLSAQLAAYEESGTSKSRSLSLRDTKTALKARVAASEKEIASREKVIAGLRRELATANERIARQASHYQDELRRLGSRGGGRGASGATAESAPVASDRTEAATPSVPSSNGKALETAATQSQMAASGQATANVSENQAAKPSLEARLAADDGGASAAGEPDFDQHSLIETADSDAKQSRGKLMDRIAGLAKR